MIVLLILQFLEEIFYFFWDFFVLGRKGMATRFIRRTFRYETIESWETDDPKPNNQLTTLSVKEIESCAERRYNIIDRHVVRMTMLALLLIGVLFTIGIAAMHAYAALFH